MVEPGKEAKAVVREEAEGDSPGLLAHVDLSGPPKIEGIVLGRLERFDKAGHPCVSFPGSPGVVRAQTTAALSRQDAGAQVALMFLQGSPAHPLILGRIVNPAVQKEAAIDGERIVLEADKEIVLRCGKASLTLTRAGKVIMKGAHLVSRSSGANKIKGASVQIN